MRKTQEYPHDLLIALKQLQAFDTALEMYEYFCEQNIKGDPGITSSCPIAMYLWRNCDDELYDIMVSEEAVKFQFMEEHQEDNYYHEISCTGAMTSFIDNFDRHNYKRLERDYGKIK